MTAATPTSARPALYGDPTRVQTLEDWWTHPDDGHQYEFVDGVYSVVPPPGLAHQRAVGELFFALRLYTREHGGFAGVAPLGVGLPTGEGFEPDVVYVRPGRESVLTARGVEGVPDVVVEVTSPSTALHDRRTKLPTYLAAGVAEVWIVDLETRLVEVHTKDAASTAPFGDAIPSALLPIGDAGLAQL